MRLVFALVLIALVAAAQDRDPCKAGYCREQNFHVTGVEAKDIVDIPNANICYPGYCSGTRYDVSGFVKEAGKNAVLYQASCYDIYWEAGPSKGRHDACTEVEAGESYRARIFPTAIDFSLGKNSLHMYQITSQHEATAK